VDACCSLRSIGIEYRDCGGGRISQIGFLLQNFAEFWVHEYRLKVEKEKEIKLHIS
jgi:hypothetical protein